jgi:ATP-binding protein involved in chromosome partitioning
MSTTPASTPTRIAQHDARTLAIDWADGARSRLDVRALRLACACAECVDEWSGEVRLAPARVPMDVAPVGIHPVGRYAIQIEWSDGHNTGIYTFERLRDMAPVEGAATDSTSRAARSAS